MEESNETKDLVGMHVYLIEKGEIKKRAYIMGRANSNYYIVQAINEVTGDPNVARLMHVKELAKWHIMPTTEIANYTFDDYLDNDNKWRYIFEIDIDKKSTGAPII